ncbi:GNAT family N-acetyltransferase [Thiothrix subterranea]|uniref:GNAT family N-acetyltransferase n=1 Tax=Thiothrix subterranea TaxID=2735563 RepID=A0AA51MRG5_9GAMM|nr:GNAT family N-acetyltransferase [Thiothrix subterranea]WML88574.1 GNAT family N-acetyltransferase [Thiothrix subterranea]
MDAAETCLFRQTWWIEALSDGNEWGEIKIELKQGKEAHLPYVIKKQFGFKILTMPTLTQTAGPLLKGVGQFEGSDLGLEKDLYYALIEKLPPHDAFNQNFHWSVTNWIPWYWKGFKQSTRYTYRLNNLSNPDELFKKFMSNIKSDIKKAINRYSLRIHSDYDVDRFLDLNEMTFKRQGKKLPYRRELVRKLDAACSEHSCRKIFFAEDPEGKIHAALYIVWDENSAYYLMGGGDPELRTSGATSLAMWEAIKFASTVTKSFDFEGSMLESVERFFRGFGATQTPYFHVWKFNSKVIGFLYEIRQLFSK